MWGVDIYQGEQIYKQGLAGFNENQQFVFAMQWYVTEVNNGGHRQFFSNSTGIIWKEAMKGFEKTRLTENLDILRAATRALGGDPSLDRTERQRQLEDYDVDFKQLDKRFYELEKKMALKDKILIFVKENRSDFYFDRFVIEPDSD